MFKRFDRCLTLAFEVSFRLILATCLLIGVPAFFYCVVGLLRSVDF